MEDGIGEILRQPEVIWFFVGLALMLLEFVLPGLIILFFGLGCWCTSLGIMLFPTMSFTMQLVLFLVASIVLLLLLRRKAKSWIGGDADNSGSDEFLEEFIGKNAVAHTNIRAGIDGKILFKGTTWEAISDHDIPKGTPVRIIEKTSIKLKIEPINS